MILWYHVTMKKLELSTKELSLIVAKSKIIGQGSYGIIYELDDDTLFKFFYKNFIHNFEKKNNAFDYRKLNDISKMLEIYKKIDTHDILFEKNIKIINLHDKILLTKLTEGVVLVNGYCVGYLLHYHKDMTNLYDFLKNNKLSTSIKKHIFNNIKKAVDELVDNNIFMDDLTVGNILINPKDNSIEIIDFEDICTTVREDRPSYLVKETQKQLNDIKDYIFENNQEYDSQL